MLVGLLAGGMLADRHDRRTLLAAVRLPQAALAAGLLANSLLSKPLLAPICNLPTESSPAGGVEAGDKP